MTEDRGRLIDEANTLGLNFHKNIPTEKLQVMVNVANSNKEPDVHQNIETQIPYMQQRVEPEALVVQQHVETQSLTIQQHIAAAAEKKAQAAAAKHQALLDKVEKCRQAACKTHIVKITNIDIRDAAVANTAFLSFENNHFGLSKIVPLDTEVELEQALIKIAEGVTIPQHVKHYVNGKFTGNMKVIKTKKYSVNYLNIDK